MLTCENAVSMTAGVTAAPTDRVLKTILTYYDVKQLYMKRDFERRFVSTATGPSLEYLGNLQSSAGREFGS